MCIAISLDKLGGLARLFAADLPGVIETRARFEIEREETDELRTLNEKSTRPRAHTAREVRQTASEIETAVDRGMRNAGRLRTASPAWRIAIEPGRVSGLPGGPPR